MQLLYPDVAGTLAEWIARGCREEVSTMAEGLWRKVETAKDDHRDDAAARR